MSGFEPCRTTVQVKKNKIQSVLTALPLLMLLIGLAVYYHKERRQIHGELILSETEIVQGRWYGITRSSSIGSGQYLLWLETDDGRRGFRVRPLEMIELRDHIDPPLQKQEPLEIHAAPTVQGSTTRWAVQLFRGDRRLWWRDELSLP